MRQYANLQLATMRQYADRVVTHTRHPAVFTIWNQKNGLTLPVIGNYTFLITNTCDFIGVGYTPPTFIELLKSSHARLNKFDYELF